MNWVQLVDTWDATLTLVKAARATDIDATILRVRPLKRMVKSLVASNDRRWASTYWITIGSRWFICQVVTRFDCDLVALILRRPLRQALFILWCCSMVWL